MSRRFESVLLVLLVILGTSIPSSSQAQERATLRVLVSSQEKGTPIPGANVLLYADTQQTDVEPRYAGVSDSEGFYEFRDLPPGRYRLRVSYVSYSTYKTELSLSDGERQIHRVSLARETRQLEEVRVEGEREVTTGEAGLRTVTGAEIDRIPSPGPTGDLAAYLQTMPGMNMIGSRGGNLYVRGGTPTQNQIRVDNLSVVKPFHISNLFSAFPSEMVQNVDTYAGGFGAEYMGATSAVIDVNLRPGNMREPSGSVAASPHLLSLQAEGPIVTDRQSYNVMARKSMVDESAPYLIDQNISLEFSDILARYSVQLDNYHCSATGLWTNDRGQINPSRNLQLSWKNTVIGGRCRGFDERFDNPFEVTVGYSQFQNEEVSKGGMQVANVDRVQAGFELEDSFFGMSTAYGVETWFSNYTATLNETFTVTESLDSGTAVVRLYGTGKWEPFDRFTVEPSLGAQVTHKSGTIEPRLRLAYRPGGGSNQELSLAAGRYSQAFNGIQDTRDAGTVFTVYRPNGRTLPLQIAYHGLLGYRHRFGDRFEATMEGYLKEYNDIPVPRWQPEAGVNTSVARADGRTYGGDLLLRYDTPSLYLLVGYGWSMVRYEAAREDLGAWSKKPVFSYSPSHDRRHKVSAVVEYRIGEFDANLRWEYGSGRPYTRVFGYDLRVGVPQQSPVDGPGTARIYFHRPYGGRLPQYHRLDASAEYAFQITPTVSVVTKVGALNVYDRDNVFFFDVNTLERVNQIPFFPYFSLSVNLR